jgi:excisionase family DNA binding protein
MYLTSRDVCELLAISRTTVDRMVQDGRLPKPLKLATGRTGALRFPKAELEAAIAALRVQS